MGKKPLEKHGITIPKPQQSKVQALSASNKTAACAGSRLANALSGGPDRGRNWSHHGSMGDHGCQKYGKNMEKHGKTWKNKNTDGDTGVSTPAVCENCWCWCEISSPLGSVARCCHRSQAKDRRMPRAYNLAGEILLVTSEIDKNITSDIGKPFRGTSDFPFTWSCRHLSECLQA